MSTTAYRLTELERRAANTVLAGTVHAVSGTTCRVAIGDIITDSLPVLSFRLLNVGDQVLVISHNGDLAQAFVVGSIAAGDYCVAFGDGTTLRYDAETKELSVDTEGSINLKAATISLEGAVKINNTPLVSGGSSF